MVDGAPLPLLSEPLRGFPDSTIVGTPGLPMASTWPVVAESRKVRPGKPAQRVIGAIKTELMKTALSSSGTPCSFMPVRSESINRAFL